MFTQVEYRLHLSVFALVRICQVLLHFGHCRLENVSSRLVVFTLFADQEKKLLHFSPKNACHKDVAVGEADQALGGSLDSRVASFFTEFRLAFHAEELGEGCLHHLEVEKVFC